MANPSPIELFADAWTSDAEQFKAYLGKLGKIADPYGILGLFAEVQKAWAEHPQEMTEAMNKLASDLTAVQWQGLHRVLGMDDEDPIPPNQQDERFAHPAWQEVPALDMLKEYYLLYFRWLEGAVYHTPDIPKKDRKRAAFWTRQWLNAIAPTNYFFTNPLAVQKFRETNGDSLLRGLDNWLKDLQVGDVQMVDKTAFEVGKNLANTPGAVVFRNKLVEVIQYAPTAEKVHAMPIVFITPWINKFYVLDLTEKKSMVRYLVNQGFTVFITSWKNPTSDMADVTFDDYLLQGALQAIEAARSICNVPQVHAVGYCIGGTALAALMAWLNREHGDPDSVPVAHWTQFASLVDFSRPGDLEVFIDETGIEAIEDTMAGQGYLDGRELGRAFRLLRANSLIWHYVVHNYLYGESLPALDVLFWNIDGTRMPKAMHGWYLRELYLKNKLVKKNGVTLGGHPIDLGLIRQPLYAVGTEEDHITPWRQTYRIANLIQAPVRYVLSTSGHILGIINPPVKPPKRNYWSGDVKGEDDPKDWLAKQQKNPGSWWEDWVAWLRARCGELQAPPPLGNRAHRKLENAPGKYVREA